jgi:UDP-N-acetylmuramoyl-L-alanyl-D-glutamate--2,6-diaminopimelate ligase
LAADTKRHRFSEYSAVKLHDLIAASRARPGNPEPMTARGPLDVEITGITSEAPQVQPGMLYAAIPGGWESDVARVPAAIAAGAAALLLPEDARVDVPDGTAVLTTANVRRAVAFLAAALAGAAPRTVVAVTGTCGKTSTADFVRQLWTMLGHRAASIGTIGLISPDWQVEEVAGTTPHPTYLHPALAFLVEDRVDHLVIEATSHALHQHRIDALPLAAAAFTNLSRDHLNYHGSMEAYFAAKQRLFSELLPGGAPAVINADSDVAEAVIQIARRRRHRLIRVGRAGSEIRLLRQDMDSAGQTLELDIFGNTATVILPVIGAFQAENLLTALGLVIATGAAPEHVLPLVARLTGVPGRLEPVTTTPSGAAVYVDYAHKPGALEAVLRSLRRQTTGRLVVLFGCGGQADSGNRRMMGAIAAEHADGVVITDDNPRGEDPAQIRAQIRAGAPQAVEIGDRAEAIRHAMLGLQSGDTLVIAGKGHETTQTIGGVDYPFEDAAVAREIAATLIGA